MSDQGGDGNGQVKKGHRKRGSWVQESGQIRFSKKLLKTLKGEKEETFGPLNPKSTNGEASIEKESSKRKASKDKVHVVEQVWSSSNSSNLNEEEEEDLECINISKKSIMSNDKKKQMEEVKKAKEACLTQRRPKRQKKFWRQNSTLKPKKSSKSWRKRLEWSSS